MISLLVNLQRRRGVRSKTRDATRLWIHCFTDGDWIYCWIQTLLQFASHKRYSLQFLFPLIWIVLTLRTCVKIVLPNELGFSWIQSMQQWHGQKHYMGGSTVFLYRFIPCTTIIKGWSLLWIVCESCLWYDFM